MSSNVSGGEIDQRALAGDDRFIVQMPGDVFAEIAGRTITALRLLAQSFQHDVVQIALQASAQAFRFTFARFDVWSRRLCDPIPAGGAGVLDRSTDDDAGRRRLLLTDHPRGFMRRPTLDSIGPMAGEQFVEHDAERVNVAGG